MQCQSFQIAFDESLIVSIDVLEVSNRNQDKLEQSMIELVKGAEFDPDFVAGAVHRSLPFYQQPLIHVLGVTPLLSREIAVYSVWQATGHRKSFSGTERGCETLKRALPFSKNVQMMLERPQSNLYVPTLLDATGELCENAEPCEAGLNVGPVINARNSRAQFINVFQTTPDRQTALLEETAAILPVARKHEGYLRTGFHRSLDGTKAANYGQYETFSQINEMYYHWETDLRFAAVALKGLTAPMELFGVPLCIGDVCLVSLPKLRNYTVQYAATGNRADVESVKVIIDSDVSAA